MKRSLKNRSCSGIGHRRKLRSAPVDEGRDQVGDALVQALIRQRALAKGAPALCDATHKCGIGGQSLIPVVVHVSALLGLGFVLPALDVQRIVESDPEAEVVIPKRAGLHGFVPILIVVSEALFTLTIPDHLHEYRLCT